MKNGYLIVIVCLLGIGVHGHPYLFTTITLSGRISIIVAQVKYYCWCTHWGHLADVYLTRYRALKSSLIILTIIKFC